MSQDRQPSVVTAGELATYLRDGRARSLSELAAAFGLSRSTVKQRVDELLGIGLVAQTGEAVSTGGRPSSQYRLQADAWLIVGIDLGATHSVVGILDLNGQVLDSVEAVIDIADGPQKVLDGAVRDIHTLLERISRSGQDLMAIGVGLPGPVEHASGRPIDPPIMPGWNGFDVPGYMASHFQVPTLVDNDVNIAALGERTIAWPDTDELVYLKVATGIGAGIIAGGTLQRGAQGTAGDIGHIRVASGARNVCRCGNVGCLEATASGAVIARELRSRGLDAADSAWVVALAQQGDIVTTQLLREAGRVIGEVLTACVSFLNPSVIVIGGPIAFAGEHLLAGIREVVYNRSMPLATRDLAIVRARTGGDAALIGASVLAAEHVLSPEFIQELVAQRAA